MLLKLSVCLILIVGTVLSASPRCCREGGLYHHRNGSYSCVPATIPDSLNIEPYQLDMSQSNAQKISINDTENYTCRDILFDEETGLVMHSLITVKMDTGSYRPIEEFKSKPRFAIKKCCKDDEVISSFECSKRTDDLDKNGNIMYKFKDYYGSGSIRALTKEVRLSSIGNFGKGGIDSSKTDDIYILGDDYLESLDKSAAVQTAIIEAAKEIDWCIHNSNYMRYQLYILHVTENSLRMKRMFLDLISAFLINNA